MNGWIGLAVVGGIGGLGYLAQRFGWIDLSNKNLSGRSGGGGIAGIGDEVFHPTRHEAQVELDRQTVLPAPAPLAGDKGFAQGLYGGRVEIDLSDVPATDAPDEPGSRPSGSGRHRAEQ